ncbi:hypothetical protein B6J44_27250 [Klebsiella pneumoniae]|nr:hypothetical protein B6J44_27250 [Klebsiella pneumoniae]
MLHQLNDIVIINNTVSFMAAFIAAKTLITGVRQAFVTTFIVAYCLHPFFPSGSILFSPVIMLRAKTEFTLLIFDPYAILAVIPLTNSHNVYTINRMIE